MFSLPVAVASFLLLSSEPGFRRHHHQTTTKLHQQAPTTTTTANNVICLGAIIMDMVAAERNTPISEVTTWKAAAGGDTANVAVALQRLGQCKASFVGCVGGQDPFGTQLRHTLSAAGVDTANLQNARGGIRTTLGFAGVWEDGRKDNCFYRGADRQISVEDIPQDLFENVHCLHVSSIALIDQPGATAQRAAMQMAQEAGCMLTYDPNYRPTLWPDADTAHHVMWDALQYAHLVKISEEEFEAVTGHKNMDDGMRAVLDQGVVELVIVSRGPKGALAATKNFCIESPALEDLNIVETTGAGDAFMAATITKVLPEFVKVGSLKNIDRQRLQEALDYANVVGGLACTRVGAIPSLPTADQVDGFLASRVSSPQRQCKEETNDNHSTLTASSLAKMIDHTFLKPHCADKNNDELEKLCNEARHHGFASVAVNPASVETCCRLLKGTDVRVGAAIAFPLGQTTATVKEFEIRDAVQRGANEVDVVMNVRELQKGNYDLVRQEIATMAQICHDETNKERVICKVILETAYLSTSEIVQACQICRDAGVDFVKTSTGFAPTGARVEDVRLMRETVGNSMGVKAAGGIRDLAAATAMIEAGATRLGTSSGVAIVEELLRRNKDSSKPVSKAKAGMA